MMHSLYFLTFAVVVTFSTVVILWAQYSRFKSKGIPFNYTILKILVVAALLMWTGAAQTVYFYDIKPITAAWAAFALGITLSIMVVWGGTLVMKEMQKGGELLKELETHDGLTRLWNRRVFDTFLEAEIDRANRINHPLSIVMLHFDNLRSINDKHSRSVGDEGLIEMGKRLTDSLRANDLLGRYKDATFGILLPHTGEKGAEEAIKRYAKIIMSPYKAKGAGDIQLEWSCGIATYSDCDFPRKDDAESEESFITRVLDAMKAAQDKEGNVTVISTKDGCLTSLPINDQSTNS